MSTSKFVPGTYMVKGDNKALATVLKEVTKKSGVTYLIGYVMQRANTSSEYLVPAMWDTTGSLAYGDNPSVINSVTSYDLVFPDHPGKKLYERFTTKNQTIIHAMVTNGADAVVIKAAAAAMPITLSLKEAEDLKGYIDAEIPA